MSLRRGVVQEPPEYADMDGIGVAKTEFVSELWDCEIAVCAALQSSSHRRSVRRNDFLAVHAHVNYQKNNFLGEAFL